MTKYEIGTRFTVEDRTRPWADGEEGVVLASYPPGAEEPRSYECLVAGRPLQITPDKMKETTE